MTAKPCGAFLVLIMLAATSWRACAQQMDGAALDSALRTALAGQEGGRAVVRLQPGTYRVRQPWVLEALPRPVLITGASNGSTSIVGSKAYPLRPVRVGDTALSGLPPSLLSSVRVIDMDGDLLASFGPDPSAYDPRRLGLYEGDDALQPARWPQAGYVRAPGVLSAVNPSPALKIDPAQTTRWAGETGLWVGGYFGTDYFFEAVKAAPGSDGALGLAQLKSKNPVQPHCRYYVYNALADLGAPGRYVVDAKDRRIYLVPLHPAARSVEVAIAPLLLSVMGAQDVRVDHIALERARGDGIVVRKGDRVVFSNDFIGQVGGRGVVFAGGHGDVIDRSVILDTGDMAVDMDGGDRQTLTPSGHILSNSIVAQYARTTRTIAGVLATGVGVKITGDLIVDGPFSAIVYGGNDHFIAGNEVARVVTEVSDFGAIYSGRDWTARGDVIQDNFLHDIVPFAGDAILGGHVEVKGVYLDDMLSGQTVAENVFKRVDQPIYVNGGRDNRVFDNVIIDPVGAPITIDDRSRTLSQPAMKAALIKALQAVPYDGPLYLQRYPELKDVMTDHPGAPTGNQVNRNRIVNGGQIVLRGAAATLSQVQAGSVEPARDVRPVHRDVDLSGLAYAYRFHAQPSDSP